VSVVGKNIVVSSPHDIEETNSVTTDCQQTTLNSASSPSETFLAGKATIRQSPLDESLWSVKLGPKTALPLKEMYEISNVLSGARGGSLGLPFVEQPNVVEFKRAANARWTCRISYTRQHGVGRVMPVECEPARLWPLRHMFAGP
jgi:hypothetical protein